ncbi:hypothetical protein [Oceanobacter mangrovi]|uniref:hypothetical protein n=1 Tax=Oceanobacter mangrovi TaxID=2862510 RepID=UPI001C8E354F|nr:hypothetical protein [Oceanobacter mangrovi]
MKKLWLWLQQRSLKDRQNLGLFVVGAVIFFCGGGLIYVANLRMEPSIQQELVVLAGLVIGATGAIIAALGYIALSVLRLIRPRQRHDKNSRY